MPEEQEQNRIDDEEATGGGVFFSGFYDVDCIWFFIGGDCTSFLSMGAGDIAWCLLIYGGIVYADGIQ